MKHEVCEIVSPTDERRKAIINRWEDGKTLISIYTWIQQERYSAEYHELGIEDVGRWEPVGFHYVAASCGEEAVAAAMRLLLHQQRPMVAGLD